VLLFEALESSDAATDDDAGSIDVVGAGGEPGVGHRLDRGGDRVLGVQIRPLGLLPLHRLQRIERLHLAGEAHGKGRGIELRDSRGSRDTRLQGTPSRRHVVADWRDGTETGDDDPTPHYAPTLVFR
jgi:hypothetical protein